MEQGWTAYIHEVRSGRIELPVELSRNNATTLLTGQGTGAHTIRTHGVSRTLIRELSEGNKYGLAIGWHDAPGFCAYQGVIQRRRFLNDSGELVLSTRELPSAMFDDRSFFGVNQYAPETGELVVADRSHSGAVRAFLAACMSPSSEWTFPINLPPDGSGSFSKTARHEEEMTLAALLDIIRALGSEIDFRPYFSGDTVRYQTRVASKITHGAVTDMPVATGGSRVVGLENEDDYVPEKTGVGAFGNGQGQVRPYAYAPTSGSGAVDKPVRDAFVTFPDIEVPEGDPDNPASMAAEAAALARLQEAADAEYARTKDPVSAIDFGLVIHDIGPQLAEPGRLIDFWSYDQLALPDGRTRTRVKGLNFDLSTVIRPEVEKHGA